MITAKTATEISELSEYEEDQSNIDLQKIQERILRNSTLGGFNIFWGGHLEQKTIDLLRDLGYSINRAERTDGSFFYCIMW